jgi:hypothetical protein
MIMMKLSPFMKKVLIKNIIIICLYQLIFFITQTQGIEIALVEIIVKDVSFPVALCYFDKNPILFTDKDGSIRIIKKASFRKSF